MIQAKIVYCGAGMAGKTTNLRYIHAQTSKGQRISLADREECPWVFDYLPVSLGKIRGHEVQLQLYSVPGQVFYDERRKSILYDADAVVFVVDSRKFRVDANLESFDNLIQNWSKPVVLQYNKRDAADIFSLAQLQAMFNSHQFPYFEAAASNGLGVFDTLKCAVKNWISNDIGD
jgi:signal recognition particle receptor subunit beta